MLNFGLLNRFFINVLIDVRLGLIGVGLINVEDRSGILTLDKGILFV